MEPETTLFHKKKMCFFSSDERVVLFLLHSLLVFLISWVSQGFSHFYEPKEFGPSFRCRVLCSVLRDPFGVGSESFLLERVGSVGLTVCHGPGVGGK
jgi:hypothetical protein